MFQRESLIKHYVFLSIDILALAIAFVLANYLRFKEMRLLDFENLYVNVFAISIVACIAGNIILKLDKHIFDRGAYQEFLAVCKSAFCIGVSVMVYFFLSQQGIHYSRLQWVYYFSIYFLISYFGHQGMKRFIAKHYKNSRSCKKIMLITSSDKVEDILEKFRRTNNWYFEITCITIVDQDLEGGEIQKIPIIANMDTMLERAKNIALDGVFINVSYESHSVFDVRRTLHDFQEMGVIVHVNIDALELDVTDKVVENLGFFKVVSYASRLREPGQLVLKRCMDIAGGTAGMIITLFIGIFVGIAIKLDSPGPVIFYQKRVGKNGRHFKMYKFRSMYTDAEERKKELMQENEMHGAMFKITNDPRITKVGRFIRKYSIDELPQFFNVLKGDMSLVGTRPPTVEEVQKYKTEQKRRLSVTPGMTGLWQTSGRSEIYDFDEIVKLDLEYIDKWSIGLDIKLLVKTIVVCVRGDGAK